MSRTVSILCFLFLIVINQGLTQESKKIKKQIETGYIPVAKDSLIPDQSESVKFFDEKGNLVEETNTRIFMNKLTVHKRKYYYNNKGCLDSSLIYSNETFAEKLVYETDKRCKILSIQEYASDGSKSFLSRYMYDSLGDKIREVMYTNENKPYNFKEYFYDKNHNLIDESGTEQSERRYHWKYIYNKKNLLTVRKDYSGKDELLRVHNYQYNQSDRRVRENIKDGKGVLQKVIKIRYEFY